LALNLAVTLRNVMTKEIVSVEKGTILRHAVRRMLKQDVGSIVVTERGIAVGILTERDVLRAFAQRKLSPLAKVEEAMSSPLITVEATMRLGDAADLMVRKKVRRLLVTQNGKITGIVTQRDLQRGMMDTFRALLLA